MLPDLTKHFHAGDTATFRSHLRRCLALSIGTALALGLFLLFAGPLVSSVMFDGKIRLDHTELSAIFVLLVGLSLICVSVYLQNGLGRFAALVAPSFAFLCGSLLSVPAAVWLGSVTSAPSRYALPPATRWSISYWPPCTGECSRG